MNKQKRYFLAGIILIALIILIFSGQTLQNKCSKVVKGEGPCMVVYDGFQYDSSIDRCRTIHSGGCDFYSPFDSLENCRNKCETGTHENTKLFLSAQEIEIGEDFDNIFDIEIKNLNDEPLDYRINFSLLGDEGEVSLEENIRINYYGDDTKISFGAIISEVIGVHKMNLPSGTYTLNVAVIDKNTETTYATEGLSLIVR